MAANQSFVSGITPPPNSPTLPILEDNMLTSVSDLQEIDNTITPISSTTRADKRQLINPTSGEKKIKFEDDRIIKVSRFDRLEKIQIVIERKKKSVYFDLPTCFYVMGRLIGALNKDPVLPSKLENLCRKMHRIPLRCKPYALRRGFGEWIQRKQACI